MYVSGRELPCTTTQYNGSISFHPCTGNTNSYDYITGADNWVLYPSDKTDAQFVSLGDYVYITVVRTEFNLPNKTCPFNITATMTYCPNGEVAVFQTSTPQCFNITILDAGKDSTATVYNITNPVLSDINGWLFYRIWVPKGSGYISVEGNLTASDATVGFYYQNRYLPGSSYRYLYKPLAVDGSATIPRFSIYNPRSGFAYIGISDAVALTGGNLTITLHACPSGFGGWNCTYPVVDLTGLTQSSDTVTIDLDNISPYNTSLYYLILDVNDTNQADWNFNFTKKNGTQVKVIYTKEQWSDLDDPIYIEPEYLLSLGSTPQLATLGPYEFYVPGRYIFGITNHDAANTSIQVTYDAYTGQLPTTTGESTTGDVTTGDVTTGSETTTTGNDTTTTTTGISSVDGGITTTGIVTLVVFTVVGVAVVVLSVVAVSIGSTTSSIVGGGSSVAELEPMVGGASGRNIKRNQYNSSRRMKGV